MAAAQRLSTVSNYGLFRLQLLAKAGVRGLVNAGIAAFPGPMLHLADYIQARHGMSNARLLQGKPMTSRTQTALVEALSSARPQLSHADVLGLLKSVEGLSELALHRYLTAALLERRLDLIEHVIDADGLCPPDTQTYHRLRLQQYRGEVLATAPEIVAAHAQLMGNPIYREQATNLAADLLVRRADPEQLEVFLEGLKSSELTKLAAPTYFGCLRLLGAAGFAERHAWLRKTYLGSLAPEQQLYFLECLPEAEARRMAGGDGSWRAVLGRFASLYSAPDEADLAAFRNFVIEPLKRLPSGTADYMNIRFDADARTRLSTVISGALKDNRPLGLVRLGDGEAYGYQPVAMPRVGAAEFDQDNTIRERMWWGRTLDEGAREAIKRQFRDAIATADIIGVPSVYRIIRDRGTPGSRFGLTGAQRGLAVVLSHLGSAIPTSGVLLTEERCHQLLFDRARLEELAAVAKKVVLVSCWTRAQMSLTAMAPVYEIVIPAHTKVAKATGMAAGAPALFETFGRQVAELERLCEPGTLVLVGAGFLGKIFIAAARAKGAVALDVGAILDYMAGYKTRSLADLG